jgi:hypothetical protein
MSNIGKERRRFDVLPSPQPTGTPEQPARPEPRRESAPAT